MCIRDSPYLDELEKIYLWGMQAYGKRPSEYVGVTAGFGANGDWEGWEAFLTHRREEALRRLRRHSVCSLASL